MTIQEAQKILNSNGNFYSIEETEKIKEILDLVIEAFLSKRKKEALRKSLNKAS